MQGEQQSDSNGQDDLLKEGTNLDEGQKPQPEDRQWRQIQIGHQEGRLRAMNPRWKGDNDSDKPNRTN